MNSFVLAQLHAVGSGAAHHAPAWAPWQRALMAASSSAYLANAVCWSRYDHPILAGVFVNIDNRIIVVYTGKVRQTHI